MAAEQVTAPGLNYYRDQAKQRPGAAPGRPPTTAREKRVATVPAGR